LNAAKAAGKVEARASDGPRILRREVKGAILFAKENGPFGTPRENYGGARGELLFCKK